MRNLRACDRVIPLSFQGDEVVVISDDLQPGSDDAPDLPAGWRRLAAVPEPEEPPDALIEATAADPGSRGRGKVIDALLEAGATDAWLTPVVRPGGESGILVSALGPADVEEALIDRVRALPGVGPVRLTPAWPAL